MKQLVNIFFLFMVGAEIVQATTTRSDIALLVVDVQDCFIEGGSLAVPGANRAYVKSVENAVRQAHKKGFLVLGSRDYHPEGHVSFASSHSGAAVGDSLVLPNGVRQTLWPDHCVQTRGDSRASIDNNLFFELVKKGEDPDVDSPSAFRDYLGRLTELHAILQRQSIKSLIVFGLATDVCVAETIKDAQKLNYQVIFVEGLSRGISPSGVETAIKNMKASGVLVLEGAAKMNDYLARK